MHVTAQLHTQSTYFPRQPKEFEYIRFSTIKVPEDEEALLVVDDNCVQSESTVYDFDDHTTSPAPYKPALSRPRSPIKSPPSPQVARLTLAASIPTKGHGIYTPSPSPPTANSLVCQFDDRMPNPALSRSRSPLNPPTSPSVQSSVQSPVAGPSWWSPSGPRSPLVKTVVSPPITVASPLRVDSWVDATDDSDDYLPSQRRTVTEKQQLAEDTPVSL